MAGAIDTVYTEEFATYGNLSACQAGAPGWCQVVTARQYATLGGLTAVLYGVHSCIDRPSRNPSPVPVVVPGWSFDQVVQWLRVNFFTLPADVALQVLALLATVGIGYAVVVGLTSGGALAASPGVLATTAALILVIISPYLNEADQAATESNRKNIQVQKNGDNSWTYSVKQPDGSTSVIDLDYDIASHSAKVETESSCKIVDGTTVGKDC